jgi:C-terminal processing protease CtpA/Prc
MYLRKASQFSRPDEPDTCGLALIRKDGRVLVSVVEDDGPAARAGIKPFDLVTRVGDLDPTKARRADVKRRLTAPGQAVRLSLRRGDREFDVTLAIPASKPAGPPAPPRR